ncbi:ribosome-associated translation inhibitor RaiA [Candidatus Nomurabacteria bacterium]|nr:ribosome-associated translation inhibitor RaiA [Candidatus Nomurabacteria bacterium]
MDIKIYNKNFDLSEAFETYIHEKLDSLEKYQENIISFSLNMSRDPHHHKGEIFDLEARLTMPNKQEIIIKESHQDARAAIDIIQDKLARQLVKQKGKLNSKLRKNSKFFKSLKFWNKN